MFNKIFKNPFFHDALSMNLLGVSFVLNLICWTILLWFSAPRGEVTILHYNVSLGIDLTGSWGMIFVIPLLGFLVILINTTLANFLFKTNKLLSWLLSSTSLLAELTTIVSAILLIIQNAPK